jgi:uncharacterized protein
MVNANERGLRAPVCLGAVRRARRALSLGLVLASGACSSCKTPPSPPSEGTATTASSAAVVVQNQNVLGRLVWHELTSLDPNTAAAFYADVAGWTVRWDSQSYTTWLNGTDPIAGMAKSETANPSGRAFWTGQVLVEDVDESVRLAREAGGRVNAGPWDMPTGRFASIGDPEGPQIFVYRSNTAWGLRDPKRPGEFFWSEYSTPDGPGSLLFFGKLFGWVELNESPVPPAGKHVFFGRAGVPLGVLHVAPGLTPGWIFYIQSADLEAAIKRAIAKQGSVLAGPLAVPDGRVAVLADPQGAVFGLHESSSTP